MSAQKREYNIASLQRGLRMLQLIGQAGRGVPASEIAKLSGLPVSTVHRFLVNLEAGGFLTKDEHSNYHLGVACVSLGQAAREQLDVRKVSLPHLEQLNHSTRETVHLTVRHKLTAVYIEKLDSPEPLRIHSRIGASVPLYCTGVGKVMLAYLGDEELAIVVNELELALHGEYRGQHSGITNSTRASKKRWLCLRYGGTRTTYPLHCGADLGPYWRGKRQPQRHWPGRAHVHGSTSGNCAAGA